MSFTDSFLDFEAIKIWFDSIPNSDMADGEKLLLEVDSCQETAVQELLVNEFCSDANAVEKEELELAGNFSSSIEEDMGKVSLVTDLGNSIDICENGPKSETMEDNDAKREAENVESGKLDVVVCESGSKSETIDENAGTRRAMSGDLGNLNVIGESGTKSEVIELSGEEKEVASGEDESESSEAESASTSSSSSSSSCSSSNGDDSDVEEAEDREETKAVERGEVEEGEIRDADLQDVADDDNGDDEDGHDDAHPMMGWSDVDDEGVEGGDDDGLKGPIRSKNEATVLPPVPSVDATLLPNHVMQPVGVVLSIVGTQVIVEGMEKHSPLSDGSILWITESRSPLGLVDEIFGPVKNPYYIVRYNSEAEVPAGISTGTSVSFVPEFASHVLDNKDIHKKGYDASGANDEELSDDGDFSDDEKEAEFKRMQKSSKRGTPDQKPWKNKNNKKSVESRGETWRRVQQSPQQTLPEAGPIAPNQHQHHHQFSPFPTPTGLAPTLPPMWPNAPSNGVWSNGMPFQQPQGVFFPSGFASNNMPWPSPNSQQYTYQMPMPNNLMPFNQQVNPSRSALSGQPNNSAGMPFGQGFAGQNGFNTVPFGMNLQGQSSPSTLNIGEQGFTSNGLVMGQNFNMPQSGGVPGNNDAPRQFNPSPSSRGRGSYRRGGGRFSRRRGRKQ